MNNFDRLIVPGCEQAIEQRNAKNTCNSRDPRCDDQAFADANPSICGLDPRCGDSSFAEAHPELCGPSTSSIVLKPAATILCKNKSVQLHTFIRQGTSETEITSGLTYRSSDQTVALVGAIGGNVTGISEGAATISVEWMGKIAYAEVDVKPTTDCCEDISNTIILVADTSKSMSVSFGGTYANKLGFVKAAAAKFINGLDLTKDSVALYSFNEAVTQVVGISSDPTALLAGVNGLASTAFKTNIHEALDEAIQVANDSVVDGARKVIVLFSDFENKLGDDPVPLAQSFFASGGIIIVVGVRTNGIGFVLGNKLATGGFFINAYSSVAAVALSALDGIKAYFCSGACIPKGDVYASRSALNFTAFTNWDVTDGLTDLIGTGSDGVALYDLIPGHGLYIDMAGSGPLFSATIQTKQTFSFEPGNNYRITLRIAGNQRTSLVSGKTFANLGTILVNEQIDRIWTQDFTDEIFDFSVAASATAKLNLKYVPDGADNPYGFLLDWVKIENITTGEVFLTETWDNENTIYIPPGCGVGTVLLPGGVFAYGYDCGSDCLNIPPDTQKPDPIIANEIEDAAPPPIYTSTKSATATCPAGTTGASVTKTATTTSAISQADADAKATAMALEQATAALSCSRPAVLGDLISIAFHDAPVLKTGFAAFGLTSMDYWNAAVADKANLKFVDGALSGLKLFGTSFTVVDIPAHPDPLMQHYGLAASAINPVIGPLPIGEYEIYAYAHGANDADNSTFIPQVGSYNEGTGVFTAETSYPTKTTENGSDWALATWSEGKQYVKFKVVNGTAGKYLRLLQSAGASGLFLMTGIQLRKTLDGPTTAAITINDNANATPFPSIQFVEGKVGVITAITLQLTGFHHTFPDDVDMLLVGPDGTHVMIMSDAGGGLPGVASPINIVFDDAGVAPVIPDSTAIVAGTYKTKDWNAIQYEFGIGPTIAAPPGPHSANLLAFVGKPANGAWRLFVVDDSPGDNGAIAGWSLNITSA